MKHHILLLSALLCGACAALAQPTPDPRATFARGERPLVRYMQYFPQGEAFMAENGSNRFTRALYATAGDYRVETSDRPIFALVKRGMAKSVRFEIEGVPLDSTDFCKSWYRNGIRTYLLGDHRWDNLGCGVVRVHVVALPGEEGAVWQFIADQMKDRQLEVAVRVCDVAHPQLVAQGELGIDPADALAPSPTEEGLVVGHATRSSNFAHLVMKGDKVFFMNDGDAFQLYQDAAKYRRQLSQRIEVSTPDSYVNTVGMALGLAADGLWNGQTFLPANIGWLQPPSGWRTHYIGDLLGWGERARTSFAHVFGQPVPAANADEGNLPELLNQLTAVDALLSHFQMNADAAYMKRMWPVLSERLQWERQVAANCGADVRILSLCCRANTLGARVAELLGEDPTPCSEAAETMLNTITNQLWMAQQGHWAGQADGNNTQQGVALWDVYTPIDCGACTPGQAFAASQYVDRGIAHFTIDSTLQVVANGSRLGSAWTGTEVMPAEVMQTALAHFQAGRRQAGFNMLKACIVDQMFYGHSPGNFAQLSFYDDAYGECCRDVGDCIGSSARALLQGLFGISPQALYKQCVVRPGFPPTWDKASLKTPYIEYKYTRENGRERHEITQHFAQPLKMVVRQSLGNGQFRDIEGSTDYHQVIECEAAQ